MSRFCPHLDKVLGMDGNVTRRDFLDGALMASGAALLAASAPVHLMAQGDAWAGYSGEGDYRDAAGNTDRVVQDAHSVRDGIWDKAPAEVTDTGEFHDCVVVGGGFAGLSAGLFFKQRASGDRTCLILDNSSVFGETERIRCERPSPLRASGVRSFSAALPPQLPERRL